MTAASFDVTIILWPKSPLIEITQTGNKVVLRSMFIQLSFILYNRPIYKEKRLRIFTNLLKNTSEKNNSNSCRRIGGGAGLFLHSLVAGDAYWWTVGSIRTLVTKCPTILINNAGLWHVVHFLSVAWWSYDEVSQIFYYLSLHFSLLIFMMIFRGILAVGLRGVRTQSNFSRLLLDQEFIVIVK